MNNFEKRKFLDYLEKLLHVTDTSSYAFDTVFDFMIDEFKMDKKLFPLDEDGNLDLDTSIKRMNFAKVLREEVKKLKENIKPQNTILEKQFNIVKEIYDLKREEYEIFLQKFVKS